MEDHEMAAEDESWSNCSESGHSSPENMNIQIRRSGSDLLHVVGIENGVTHRAILQFDTCRPGM